MCACSHVEKMREQQQYCDPSDRNDLMVMEPHEKVFSVDADLKEKSLLAVVADSASIHTLLSPHSNPDLAGLEGNNSLCVEEKTFSSLRVKSVRTNTLFMMNKTRQPHCYLQVSLSLRFKELYLYTGGVLLHHHVECCIGYLLISLIIIYNITSIEYKHHTDIYPLLNI